MTSFGHVTVLLASASQTRQTMLRQAGVPFTVEPADVDERALKYEWRDQALDGPELATALAKAKAISVSADHPEALVIGADQVLTCDGQFFDKVSDLAAAAEKLRQLSGRRHELHSALCVVQGSKVIWRYADTAELWLRELSDEFIDGYLDRAGPAVLSSVGCYQIEGLGAQLFERVVGDYFTILGLPLLPLLNFLRHQGVVPT